MILVYGASGFTGRLIARELSGRGAKLAMSGRDHHRLEATARELDIDCDIRPARVLDPEALAGAMRDCRVVINCAGPFTKLGEPVVRAAIDAGVHYLDTTGEQGFMRDIYERYESPARKAGVAVVNAMAFEIAIGDWAGTLAAAELLAEADEDDEQLDELTVSYAIAGPRISRGTQLSIVEVLSRPGNVWRIDRWEAVPPAGEVKMVRFPEPFGQREALSFPSGEVVTLPRHVPTRFAQTYMSLAGNTPATRMVNRLANVLSPALPLLVGSPLGAFAKARIGAVGHDLSERERAATQFAVVAEAVMRFERRRVEVCGFDVYGQTAHIATNAALDLCERESVHGGVLAPSELFDPADGLDALYVEVTFA